MSLLLAGIAKQCGGWEGRRRQALGPLCSGTPHISSHSSTLPPWAADFS